MATKSDPDKRKTKILLVDDHPILRQGLAQFIDQEPDLTACGEAEDVSGALAAIDALRPDMAVVDISLKGGDGLELLKHVKVRRPDLPVLILSMHDETVYAERCLRAGAQGYIMKGEPTEKVMAAIRCVLSGEIYASTRIVSKVLRKIANSDSPPADSAIDVLSDRELEVLLSIGRGSKTSQIASDLGLSVKTVETYREHIKKKLSLKDAKELQEAAITWTRRIGN